MAEYIEREALINNISYRLKPVIDVTSLAMRFYSVVENEIRLMPAADVVEVRHGEWLPYPSDAYMKCSVCGMEYQKSRMPDVVGYCPNPNCGAKMDGKGEGNG